MASKERQQVARLHAKSLIVYGPKACGKTRHAKALAAHFGCMSIVDDFEAFGKVVPGALHLTSDYPFRNAKGYRQHGTQRLVKVMNFEEAMLAAGFPVQTSAQPEAQ